MKSNMNPEQPWATLKEALTLPPPGGKQTKPDSDNTKFAQFSSTCYYFGESLSDQLAAASADGVAPPIGLVHTSFGGSAIEQWLTNETIATCSQAGCDNPSRQTWHDQRVMPYAGMTLKGWIWYQGENDMHNFFGNSKLMSGYACMMKALVTNWRKIWR